MENDRDDNEDPAPSARTAASSYCTDTPDFRDPRATGRTPDIQGAQRESTRLLESQGDTEYDGPSVNPEPPKEIVEGHLLEQETIGSTVFSKHWLFTTLMNLIQAVDSESQKKEETETSEYGMELEESLQDELCKLWDMAMNPDVVKFLQEFKAIDILTGVIAKSKAPRAVEICVGILGNMACNEEICRDMATNEKLRDLILLLLDNPDAPTLVETMRLLHVCVSTPVAQEPWIASIKKEESVFPNVSFILQSSTNNDLLQSTASFTDTIMYQNENICKQWSCDTLVQSVLEALKQIGSLSSTTFETFLHIFQLMSTCESGVGALAAHADALGEITLSYLIKICEEDIVSLEDRQNGIGSALSVLVVLCSSWKDSLKLVTEDYQLIRCTLKLLHVLHPKYLQLRNSQEQAADLKPTPEDDGSNTAERRASNSEKLTNEEAAVESTESTKTPEQKDQAAGRSSRSSSSSSSGSSTRSSGKIPAAELSEEEKAYEKKMVEMLYDVLQGQVVELVSLLSQLPEKTEETPTPKSLVYLETMCERPRLRCMLLTLRDAEVQENKELISVLEQTVPVYNLERLGRIIHDTLVNGVT